jgi:hypothetical protein
MHKGLSAGAAIAFLLTGPATNIVTFGILSTLHGRRVAVAFGLFVTGLAVCLGYVVNMWLPAVDVPLHELAVAETSPLNVICLALLGILFLVSLFRQGPRGFIEQLAPLSQHEHHHHHEHEPAEHHAHEHG